MDTMRLCYNTAVVSTQYSLDIIAPGRARYMYGCVCVCVCVCEFEVGSEDDNSKWMWWVNSRVKLLFLVFLEHLV